MMMAQPTIATDHTDNFRLAVVQETALTPTNIIGAKFGQRAIIPLAGIPYSQILYITAITVAGSSLATSFSQAITRMRSMPLMRTHSYLFGLPPLLTRRVRRFVRIPLKAISDSGGKPITIPEANRSGVGAKRRWHFDVAKTDRNRQAESVRSEAKEEVVARKGCGERGSSPLPRLSTQ